MSAPAADSKVADLVQEIESAQFPQLTRIWTTRDASLWAGSPQLWRTCAERLISIGEPLLAYDVSYQGTLSFPDDLRVAQLLALSLARMGSIEKAHSVAGGLKSRGHDDEETLGIFARTCKDIGLAKAGPERNQLLREARDLYAAAYRRRGGYWTAINAATLSLLIDDTAS